MLYKLKYQRVANYSVDTTYELPFGECATEADLPAYVERGRKGMWNRTLLQQVPNGTQWEKMVEGCLIPNFKERLQSVDDVLALMPQSIKAKDYRPTLKTSFESWSQGDSGIQLHIMQGEEYGKIYRLDDMVNGVCRLLTMGREDDETVNSIPIKDTLNAYISRCHCTLEQNAETGLWIIRDGQWRNRQWNNSMNGTYVNSTEVGCHGFVLQVGDIITIGDTKLRVEGYPKANSRKYSFKSKWDT